MAGARLPLRQRITAGELPRHRHADGYLALVLAGSYEEAGDLGRRRVTAGDVIVHRPFEAHLNRVGAGGAELLNLPLPMAPLPPFARVTDPDAVVHALSRGRAEALHVLCGQLAPVAAEPADWPDELAFHLGAGGSGGLRRWARAHDLSPEHVSRGFRKVFGVSPQRYRAERRAHAALCEIRATTTPLATIAQACGFADQAHMGRAVRALTGRTPGAWRRSTAFNT